MSVTAHRAVCCTSHREAIMGEDVMLVGFTGTPLLKTDKNSLETFGTYIHTYKFDEAVNDRVVLDLRYEA